MDFQLAYMTPTGEAIVLLSGTTPAHQVPNMALKLAELEVYIPGLRLVVNGYELTTLTFKATACSLGGEPVHYFTGIEPS